MSAIEAPSRRTFLQLTGLTAATTAASLMWPATARAAAATPPVILSDQVRSAAPGEGLGLAGSGFLATELISFWPVSGSGGLSTAGPTSLPATPPATATAGAIIAVTDTHLFTKVPASLPTGPVAVYVSSSDHTAWGKPLLLNGARGWFVDRPRAQASSSVTLFGRDLTVGTATPAVSLGSGSTLYSCTITSSNPYALTFTVPTALAPGTYTVYVGNGLGGPYAFDDSVSLTVIAAPSGTPTAIDVVADYGADPTGSTDSTTSLQNALDAAAASGVGAVVTIPAGTYVTSAKLKLPATMHPVTLQGSTTGTSLFRFGAAATYPASVPTLTAYDCYGISAADDIGMLYLAPATGPVTLTRLAFDAADKTVICLEVDGRSDVTVSECAVTNDNWPTDRYLYSGGYGIVAQNCQRLTVSACTVTANSGIFVVAGLDCVIQNSTFALSYPRAKTDPGNPAHQADQDGIKVWGARRMVIRGNTFDRGSSTYYYARAVQLGALKLPSSAFGAAQACGVELAYVGDNQIRHAGEPGSNCGETIVGDQFNSVTGGRVALSASGATSTTISTSAATFDTTSPATDAVGTDVLILSGTGTGQVRRVTANTTTQLTIATPWDVLPTAGSVFVVLALHKRQIHRNNTMTACPKYLGNYGPGAFCVYAGNSYDGTGAVSADPPTADAAGIDVFGVISSDTTPRLDPNWYDEILDNTLTSGHVAARYADWGAAAASVPAGAVLRSNRIARNQVSNADAAVVLGTVSSPTGTTGTMGKCNLSVGNLRGSSTTLNTVIVDNRWDKNGYQGPASDLSNSGTNTVTL